MAGRKESAASASNSLDSPVKLIQLEGLVVLKIIKHYQEEGQGSEVVQGVLLGLVVEDRLEITNCFPFPQHTEDDVDFDEGPETKPVMCKDDVVLSLLMLMLVQYNMEQNICQRYDELMTEWEKKVERMENNPRRKAKDSRTREYYERQFPEIRKQREQQERFQRVGQRGTGLSATIARSEHEISEIIDGLSEQENNEKQMRQLSVIPPMMYDSEQRRVKFINMNGLMDDPMKVYKSRQFMNVWTEHEKALFKEKFVQHPKNFGLIASFLERKGFSRLICTLLKTLLITAEDQSPIFRESCHLMCDVTFWLFA
ncbi:hypothetical protein IRJ41_006593 [Triplophysa rosa]|uniref:SANT domain-containing protein n=1 Tax=Triplophysa rosa TaxID=992332 RepID=A0A9W8C3L3_TRIRA|nr:hypothetical protein IRJ41_006593 [Triplophysa rosa]